MYEVHHHDDHDESRCSAFEEPAARRIPQPHSCWVCASQGDFAGEPGLGVKARCVAEDFRLAKAVEQVGRALLGLSWVSLTVAVLLLGLAALPNTDGALSSGGNDNPALFSALVLGLAAVGGLGSVLLLNTAANFSGSNLEDYSGKDYKCHTYDIAKQRALCQILSGALRIPTVSYDVDREAVGSAVTDLTQLDALNAYLTKSFPLIHASNSPVKRTAVNRHSLLFEWNGVDASLAPVMLCAHLDVVPCPEETLANWEHPPFSGHVDDEGTVWGRGAIDNKHNLLMQLQAVEDLLASGIKAPARTLFLAFGHDEEVGGVNGAQHIATALTERLASLGHPKLAFIMDEGTFIVKGVIPGVTPPIALIANSEKGNVNVKLSVNVNPPGHSSMPPNETNLGILSRAISRLEARPQPPHIDMYFDNLRELGNHLSGWLRVVVANRWLFRPILTQMMLTKPQTAACVRTTTAVTISHSGAKINMINCEAFAWINHRIHPGDLTKERVLAYDKKVIDDPRVKVEFYEESGGFGNIEPSPVSSISAAGYKLLKRTIARCFGDIPCLPACMPGNTDTRWYWNHSDHIYRHSPLIFNNISDTAMFHGLNERITQDQLAGLLHFYSELIQSLDTIP